MYASVLPLPVCEWIASDSPRKTRRAAACWMGSGARTPIICTRESRDDSIGSPAKNGRELATAATSALLELARMAARSAGMAIRRVSLLHCPFGVTSVKV